MHISVTHINFYNENYVRAVKESNSIILLSLAQSSEFDLQLHRKNIFYKTVYINIYNYVYIKDKYIQFC